MTNKEVPKLERCGFCGMFFRGVEYVPDEELDNIEKEVLNNIPLGYCPNANNEAQNV